MSTSATGAFDLLGPLPTGTTVLEASAGTGKTYAIGALVTRYVAEGVADLEDLLVVTFGRAATRELRSRVRLQLREAEQALAAALSGEPAAATADAVVRHLLTGDADELALRHQRLVRALSGYDAATIATIHEFCQLVLRSLGVAGDVDPGVRLVENLDDLLREVVDDVYLACYGALPEPPFPHAVAMRIGQDAVEDPQAELMPQDAAEGSPEQLRHAFASRVRAEVQARKRERGVLGFDDLLSRLAASLAADGSRAGERMRDRWRIVLVDEFQDTDPVQWEVFRRAFHGHATMVLVGDPKQAIYAFRGGDVPSYLAARETAATTQTLDVNWRSDAELVGSLGVLLHDVELGDPRIRVHPVTARHAERRLRGAPDQAPVRVRVVHGADLGTTKAGYVPIDKLRRHIATDLAADVAGLLASGATFDGRPVLPRDIAILLPVRTGLEHFRRELTRRGVPSVVTAGSNVLAGPAGQEWLILLEALDQPQITRRVRALALTSLMGVGPAELDAGGDRLTDELAERVRRWLDLFRSRGVAAVFEAVRATGLAERVLALDDGRRHLTDLAHIAETLHDVARRRRLGTSALLEWLHEERDAGVGGDSSERTRRLDTDEDAVQILTVHGSKGLQFPFVYLPLSFHGRSKPRRETWLYHHDGRRCLDVSGAPAAAVRRAAAAEDLAEELRLTYVALTRAEAQVTLWSAQSKDSDGAGISRLLLGRAPGETTVRTSIPVGMPDAEVDRRLAAWCDAGAVAVGPAEPGGGVAPPTPAAPVALAARAFDREVDTSWRRTSYSGLIRAEDKLAGTAGDSEPEEAGTVDETAVAEDDDDVATPGAGQPDGPLSPMSALPAGATFGSLVHGVLEQADPSVADLRAELRDRVVEQLRRWPVEATPDDLADGLLPMQHTPLGPLAGGLTLARIGLPDRLCELEFEFPLVGGDAVWPDRPRVPLREIGEVMAAHLPADDPMRPYVDRLAAPSLGEQVLRGYLSGSIDVVLRVPPAPGTGGDHRFVVVDYKTNRLGVPDRPLTAWDYTAGAMAESMMHSHYPLQAMLYSVVLHRYLRWRLPGYDPARHLGGVLYLYVRGMCGPQTPVVDGQPCGVLAWSPPAAMVVALSELLAGAVAR